MARRLAALIFFVGAAAVAQDKPLLTMNLVKSGMMLLKTNSPGVYVPAPTVETNVALQVRGIVLRGEVRQRFRNPESTCAEAVYVFPLPETAAVDGLRMRVGDRVIEGEIHERKEAEQIYEQAKSEGKQASMLSQERPNLFTASIANVGAGQEVVVTIDYQQTVEVRDGAFRFRFPTAIGPRYDPSGPSPGLQPPTPRVAGSGQGEGFHLSVDLDSGVPLRRIDSPYFKTDATTLSPSHYLISVVDAPADRDFELVWQPDLGSEPKSALFMENDYGLLMLMPPSKGGTRLPKESIFIIDTSGSMAGPSLEAAKNALLLALERLSPRDRFDIIEFNSETKTLFDAPQPATADNLANAKQWVNQLDAEGGTEMLPALQAALHDSGETNDGIVRQVVFMTDGDVSNESELFSFIREHLGRSRLFTVGIGSAPNSHFMRNAARFGRGTFTYIANAEEVQEKMTALFEKLESPVLSGIDVRFDDPAAEMWPQRVPDLYAGEPVVVTVKFSHAAGRVIVSGEGWHETHVILSRADGEESRPHESGIAKLWARAKIETLTDTPNDDTRQKIVELALLHHLVTRFTSLVAVDTTPSSVPLQNCETRQVPVNLPAGWGGIEGSLPRTATPAQLQMLIGAFLIAIAVIGGRACVLK
ncbi:MAG TPA: marine proteobacterial sortase target protein [Thermoanaerobaculia bacterium]|nr:marine proteobacterial sortase target protein [Thermoanaerobaculia bacterium]